MVEGGDGLLRILRPSTTQRSERSPPVSAGRGGGSGCFWLSPEVPKIRRVSTSSSSGAFRSEHVDRQLPCLGDPFSTPLLLFVGEIQGSYSFRGPDAGKPLEPEKIGFFGIRPTSHLSKDILAVPSWPQGLAPGLGAQTATTPRRVHPAISPSGSFSSQVWLGTWT